MRASFTRHREIPAYLCGKKGWTRGDLNPWPPPCEGGALPTELRAHNASKILAFGARIARSETGGGAEEVAGSNPSQEIVRLLSPWASALTGQIGWAPALSHLNRCSRRS